MSSAPQSAPIRKGVFRFSVFELDVHAEELRKFGTRIPLQRQPLQVLTALVERTGEIVSREELRQQLWPAEIFVDFEHSLNSAVKKLRRALNDDSVTPRFIETVPKRGYRFLLTVTREEPKPPPPQTPRQQAQPPRGRWRRTATILATAAIFLLIFAWWIARSRIYSNVSARTPIRSVAVLPLQNLSRDPDQEYFADGLTDALISDLGKLGSVRVISRTSVMRYKTTTKSLPEIARELNVDSIVEGTVMRAGDHVRVTAQLVRAQPEEHLWAESYERDLSNVLQLQDEVSRNIANQIQSKIRNEVAAKGTTPRAVNPEAYDAYLRGRYFLDKRLEGATRTAIAYFEQAIEKDPSYAPAYSGLADCYTVTWSDEVTDGAKGEAYARQALSLQEDLAEAHASLGIQRLYAYDLRSAERELKRAIELNSNYSPAHHWYALYLMAVGRAEEALTENDIARAINPFSVPVNNARGMILLSLRRYDDSLKQADRLREIEDIYTAHSLAAAIYRIKKMHREELAEQEKFAALSGNQQRVRDQAELARVYVQSGYTAYLEKSIQLKAQNYNKPYNASEIAIDCIALGNTEEAIQWVQRSFTDHDFDILRLKADPEFDLLRSDPRFQEIIRRYEAEG